MAEEAVRCVRCEVWSSGLETWSPACINADEVRTLTNWHDKSVNGVPSIFARDPLGRWFKFPFPGSSLRRGGLIKTQEQP
jgi:hypothetical protein